MVSRRVFGYETFELLGADSTRQQPQWNLKTEETIKTAPACFGRER
jgi:hypothetical protein